MARQTQKQEKPITAPRPQSIILTDKQDAFVDNILKGEEPHLAAHHAGYANGYKHGVTVMKNEKVQAALRDARDELSSAAQIRRADVIDGIMEAIGMARLAADPATMIKGWTEVGKILGHYTPEVKRVEVSMNQKRLQSKYEAMTDEELLRIIDGECEEVPNE